MLVSSEAEERNNRRISVKSKGKREGGGEERNLDFLFIPSH